MGIQSVQKGYTSQCQDSENSKIEFDIGTFAHKNQDHSSDTLMMPNGSIEWFIGTIANKNQDYNVILR